MAEQPVAVSPIEDASTETLKKEEKKEIVTAAEQTVVVTDGDSASAVVLPVAAPTPQSATQSHLASLAVRSGDTAVLAASASVGTQLLAPAVISGSKAIYHAATPVVKDAYGAVAPVVAAGAKKAYHAVSEIDFNTGLAGIKRTYDKVDFLVEKAIAAMPDPRDIDIKIIMRAAGSIKKVLSSAIDTMTPDNAQDVLDFVGKSFKFFANVILKIIKEQ